MSEEDKIIDLYQRYWQFMIKKNEAGLRSLVTEDYSLRHMTGVTQSVDDFLRGLKNGTFNYYSAEHDSTQAYVKGDEAVFIGKSRVVAAVYGGGKNSWRLEERFTLRKENGNWRFSSSQVTTY